MPHADPKPLPANSDALLGLLEAVEADENVTQRRLSSDLGIALGLVNTYLKACVKKGLIKVRQIPRRRYAYYLTPHGFAEKSRLTTEFLSDSFSFYRRIRSSCAAVLQDAASQGWRKVVLLGASEISEIAALCAQESTVEIVAIFDPDTTRRELAGLPIVRRLDQISEPVHGAILSVVSGAETWYAIGIENFGKNKVLVPTVVEATFVNKRLVDNVGH